MYEEIPEQFWADLESEFTLPSLEQVRTRIESLTSDPEPVMRRLVRVFVQDDTFCPGFQFLPGGGLHPGVLALFGRALELNIPHNTFTRWMLTALPGPGVRPVDAMHRREQLLAELSGFARRTAPPPVRR
ncbi:MAG TPA: hypothetical protein VF885_10340 [Arthrobacter sp.]